jgi:hypothetical protein
MTFLIIAFPSNLNPDNSDIRWVGNDALSVE